MTLAFVILAITFSLPLPLIIQGLIAVVLPLVVGLVTTRLTDGGAKAALLAVLTLITSGLTEFGTSLSTGTDFDLGTWLIFAVGSFLTSVGFHLGLWKPSGATAAAQATLRTDGPHEGA